MSAEERHYLNLLQKQLQKTLTDTEHKELMFLIESDPNKALLWTFLNTQQDQDTLEAEIIYEKTSPNDLSISTYTKKNNLSWYTKRHWYKYMAATACILFLIGLFWSIDNWNRNKINGIWESIATDKGERKFFRMNDGTEIWLNSASKLKVKKGYGQEHRIMSLEGEAYFSVTRNERLPLRVSVMDTEIEVLGTTFNIKAYPEDNSVSTSLIEGKVKLHVSDADGRKHYVLEPGDKIEVLHDRPTSRELLNSDKDADRTSKFQDIKVDYKKIFKDNNEDIDLLWVENKLVFNSDTFESVVKKLERWYNRTIIIVNNNIKEESFSGVFQEQTCEQVLDLLQKTDAHFSYIVEDGIIYLN